MALPRQTPSTLIPLRTTKPISKRQSTTLTLIAYQERRKIREKTTNHTKKDCYRVLRRRLWKNSTMVSHKEMILSKLLTAWQITQSGWDRRLAKEAQLQNHRIFQLLWDQQRKWFPIMTAITMLTIKEKERMDWSRKDTQKYWEEEYKKELNHPPKALEESRMT